MIAVRSAGSSTSPSAGGRSEQKAATERWSGQDYAMLVAVTLLAAGLRFFNLDTVPPGFYHDEAISGLAGLDVLRGQPVVLYGFDAREPVFHWLIAFWQLFMGATVVAVRGAAALSGTITVAVLYLLSRRMFGPFVAVCASAGLAVSSWHLVMSRYGVASVTVPLLLTVSCYLLWSGISSKPPSYRVFLLAGLSFGATGYTYLAARAVPILLGSFVLWQALTDRPRLRRLARPYLLGTLAAAATLAPLLYTLLKQPDLVTMRMSVVSLIGQPDAPWAIARSALRTLGMFTVAGDPEIRNNVNAQPVFDPVSGGFFVLGLLVALRRWRQPGYALTVLWLLAMLLPGVLSIDSPQFIRTLGAAPATYMLFGIGIVALGEWVRPRLSGRTYLLLVAAGFVALTLLTYQRYFRVWAADPAVAQAFEMMLSEPARYLAASPATGETVIVGDAYAREYPQVFQYLANRSIRQVTWYDDNTSLLLPESAELQSVPAGSIFVVVGNNATARELLRGLPAIESLGPIGGAGPASAPEVFRSRAPVLPWRIDPTGQLALTLGDEVRLEAYRLTGEVTVGASDRRWQASVAPGRNLSLQTQWSPLHPEERRNLRLSFQLVDAAGQRWAGQDVEGYPTALWRGSEKVVTFTHIPVPANAPPGRYELRVGAYWYGAGTRLPLLDGDGKTLGDSARMAVVKVTPAQPPEPADHPVGQELTGGPVLQGYSLQRTEKELLITLYWQTAHPIGEDYVVFVHVFGPDGSLVAQHDGQPAGGRFPTSFWSPAEVVQDGHVVTLGPDLHPGTYGVQVGMYHRETGRRLATTGEDAIALPGFTAP